MYDGQELKELRAFLIHNQINHDISKTGGCDSNLNAENDVYIFARNEFEVELVKAFLSEGE